MQLKKVGRPERFIQDRVIDLLDKTLGYKYLGNWFDRENNSNIEIENLRQFLLKKQGYSMPLVNRAIYELNKVAEDSSHSLYDVNRNLYSLLRYGIQVKADAGENAETVWLINWAEPEKNEFAIAEEVTITGEHTKRPDIVIFVNGIALAVLELKRSTVSVTEGIRQNRDNQQSRFIQGFFRTMQFVAAGNDSEGLRYGTIGTSEKHYLTWKEISPELNSEDKYLLELTQPIRALSDKQRTLLDQHIVQLFNKGRFLELIHDFVTFDRGQKKLCRPHQYFGIKAAQNRIKRREGGIIWHTQGSGKSLTMLWLTKWIRGNIDDARVLIITDREELDEQIEKVFKGVNESIVRTKSGKDLVEKLNTSIPWLLCSLIHKFANRQNENDVEGFVDDLKQHLPPDFSAKGNIFCFVDECHRTQSGDLHRAMKAILPNALFIGFTGTPLLKTEKKTSIETFGSFIHKYRFDEAVKDKVVLDLRYEARNIEQKVDATESIDLLFETKTSGLSAYAKAELKQRWGTMKNVFSSKGRLDKIVADIFTDMETRERLKNGRGNAILVAGSVYQACRYYEFFQNIGFTKCAVISSYAPHTSTITGEDSGEGKTEKLLKFEIYRKMLAAWFNEDAETASKRVEEFEKEVTKKFIDEPAQMKLLIVVDKLLTGFDAPSATYLYIDKKMQDHALFQAICRVNRIAEEDKEYGYVIDYQDLFNSLQTSVKNYTSNAFAGYEKEDVQGLVKDRLETGKGDFENALEQIRALYESVSPPKDDPAFIQYFCGSLTKNPDNLIETEPRRALLYKSTVQVLRTYAAISNDLPEIGFDIPKQQALITELKSVEHVRKIVQLASGDYVDLKKYEPMMRLLIDSYIGAENRKLLSKLEDMTLVQLIVEQGERAIDELKEEYGGNEDAAAETIENNLRKVIVEESATNPQYYEKMSELLIDLVKLRQQQAIKYAEYLQRIVELTKKVQQPAISNEYPSTLTSNAERALYDNLGHKESLAVAVHEAIINAKRDNWRGNRIKEREVQLAIKETLKANGISDEKQAQDLFEIVKNQREY